SIIALLVSILLPTLAAARDAARQIQCASNQRQIGLAMQIYANDHDQWAPPAISPGSASGQHLIDRHGNGARWPQILVHGNYIKSYLTTLDTSVNNFAAAAVTKGVFSCPSESAPASGGYWWGTNFGLNSQFFWNWYGSSTFRRARFAPFMVIKGSGGSG